MDSWIYGYGDMEIWRYGDYMNMGGGDRDGRNASLKSNHQVEREALWLLCSAAPLLSE